MDQWTKAAISYVLGYISFHDRDGYFSGDIEIIKDTNYSIKRWYNLFPNATTTWGKRRVKLVKKFFERPINYQSAMLIHECVHQRQYERLGKAQFFMNYINQHINHGYGDNELEEEARIHENKWRKIIGVKPIEV